MASSEDIIAMHIAAASFVTNSEVRFEYRTADTLADMISLHGAQFERIRLVGIPCGPSARRLAEAIRGTAIISRVTLLCDDLVHFKATLKDPESVGLLAATLQIESLRSFRVEQLGLDPDDMKLFCSLLRVSPITEFGFSRSHQLSIDLLSALRGISTLSSLHIEDVSSFLSLLTSPSAPFSSALQSWQRLQVLEIPSVWMGETGGIALGHALAKSSADRFLEMNVRKNVLCDSGIEAVVDGMLECYRRKGVSEGVLRRLNLASNCIEVKGGQKIAELLNRNPHLEWLNIGYNYVSGTLGTSLRACAKSLRRLGANDCHLDSQAVASVCHLLSGSQSLRYLDIRGSHASGVGVRAVSDDILAKCGALKTIILSSSELTTNDAKVFVMGLRECKSRMKHISLYSNVGAVTSELIDALPNSLYELLIHHCNVDDQVAEAVSRFIRRAYRVRDVLLNDNKFHSVGKILEAAAESSSITSLSLNDNELGLAGALCLAEIVGKCRSLRDLDIRRIGMGSEGAKAIARAVVRAKQNLALRLSMLEKITFSSEDAGEEGIRELNEAHKVVPELDIYMALI